MNTPVVSVLISVKNGERYVRETLDSIMGQTFHDFELLILDNGSKDKTADIIAGYDDPRISLIRNGTDLGMAASWNKGLSLAKGRYVARMDADDIALPERLARQVAFLDAQPRCGVVGSWANVIDEAGKLTGETWKYPSEFDEVRCSLAFTNCLIHPSVMIRSACAPHYDETYTPAEDYELWLRLSAAWDIANIPQVLLHYRLHPGSTSIEKKQQMENSVRSIYRKSFAALVPGSSPEDADLHYDANLGRSGLSVTRLIRLERWLGRLYQAMTQSGAVSRDIALQVVTKRYLYIASASKMKMTGLLLWGLLFPVNVFQKLSVLRRAVARESQG